MSTGTERNSHFVNSRNVVIVINVTRMTERPEQNSSNSTNTKVLFLKRASEHFNDFMYLAILNSQTRAFVFRILIQLLALARTNLMQHHEN